MYTIIVYYTSLYASKSCSCFRLFRHLSFRSVRMGTWSGHRSLRVVPPTKL